MIASWVAGIALVASMVPHQVRSIRMFALIGGLFGLIYLFLIEANTTALVFAAAFLVVNALRLGQLIRRSSAGVMTKEERELFDHVMKIEDPARQARLRDLMVWQDGVALNHCI